MSRAGGVTTAPCSGWESVTSDKSEDDHIKRSTRFAADKGENTQELCEANLPAHPKMSLAPKLMNKTC